MISFRAETQLKLFGIFYKYIRIFHVNEGKFEPEEGKLEPAAKILTSPLKVQPANIWGVAGGNIIAGWCVPKSAEITCALNGVCGIGLVDASGLPIVLPAVEDSCDFGLNVSSAGASSDRESSISPKSRLDDAAGSGLFARINSLLPRLCFNALFTVRCIRRPSHGFMQRVGHSKPFRFGTAQVRLHSLCRFVSWYVPYVMCLKTSFG